MRRQHHPAFISDICLLLRAHGEQRWLKGEVIPVLRDLEVPDCIPEEQLGAALAYLEVHWLEARRRGAQTEEAFEELRSRERITPGRLENLARHYHAAVRQLRTATAGHVAEHLSSEEQFGTDRGPRADPIPFRAWRRPSIFSPTPPTPTARWRHQP